MLSDVTPPPPTGTDASSSTDIPAGTAIPSGTHRADGAESVLTDDRTRERDQGLSKGSVDGETGVPAGRSPTGCPSRQSSLVQADQIRVFSFGDLSTDLLNRWEQLRNGPLGYGSPVAPGSPEVPAECDAIFAKPGTGGSPDVAVSGQYHPFFSPRFSAAVHAARGDVLVAVAFANKIDSEASVSADEAIGFLSFHRVGRVGVPVGRFLNDAQNVVGLSSERIDWRQWLRACDVVAFELHAIVNAVPQWTQTHRLRKVKAFRADFMGDSIAFLKKLERDHRTIGKQGQKTRKLAREVGDLRLEIDCRCPKVLEQAIRWKRAQYQRTHILDLFLPDWTRRLLEVLHEADAEEGSRLDTGSVLSPEMPARLNPPQSNQVQSNQVQSTDATPHTPTSFSTEPLRGILSVLWAGDQAVAAHIGMIEKGQLHYWFPTYDPAFSRYSPGTALFTEIVRQSSAHAIDSIDMGYGEQPYKQKQTATTSEVAFGIITESKWQRTVYSLRQQMVACLKRIPMKEVFKRGWRTVFPTAGIQKLS